MTKFTIKRAYQAANPDDGYRILVDRIWPRGVSKQEAKIDHWAKDLAPSTELRKWFGHDPARFDEFKQRYQLELDSSNWQGDYRQRLVDQPVVTLVYAAKDQQCNHAIVLQEVLEQQL